MAPTLMTLSDLEASLLLAVWNPSSQYLWKYSMHFLAYMFTRIGKCTWL